MPKRLLHYALSRLEIVDTDALGLQNLDISWGKKNKFEFADVGLRLRKIEALLQLPTSFELVKARILLLRVTVPVNITRDPVVIEVEGVECQIRIKEKDNKYTNHDRKRKRRASGGKLGQSGSHRARPGSSSKDDETIDSELPTAADLAESFLQAEPEGEKAELEAALLLETQEDIASSVMSEDGSLPVGTGTALSVPDWIARVLQGIVDRIAIKISGVTINLDVGIPHDPPASSSQHTADSVTVQLKIDNVDVEGVTHDLETISASDSPQPGPVLKEGKRLICLNTIRGALISEANTFSSLARTSTMSSPSVAQSNFFEERNLSQSFTNTVTSIDQHYDGTSSPVFSTRSSSSKSSTASISRRTSDSAPLYASVVVSDGGRFDDAAEEDEDIEVAAGSPSMGHSATADSEFGDNIFQSSTFLQHATDGRYDDPEQPERFKSPRSSIRHAEEGWKASPLSTPKASVHMAATSQDLLSYPRPDASETGVARSVLQSATLPARVLPRFSEGRVSQSQGTLPVQPAMATNFIHDASPPVPDITNVGSDGSGSSSPEAEEDLTQSRLFSHEEAESMYMSALSHASHPAKISGDWSRSGEWSESDGSLSPIENRKETKQEFVSDLQTSRHADSTYSLAASRPPQLPLSGAIPQQDAKSSATYSQQAIPIQQSSSTVSERSIISTDEDARMLKQLFNIDQILIYLPGSKVEADPDISQTDILFQSSFDGNASESDSMYLPGAFSTHLPGRGGTPSRSLATQPAQISNAPKVEHGANTIEVMVRNLFSHFDIPVGRLLWRLTQRLQEAIKQEAITSDSQKEENKEETPNWSFSADTVSLQYLDRLDGALVTSTNIVDSVPWIHAPESDVLLRLNLDGLSVDNRASISRSETELRLKKFSFGYAQENILSFDASLQMRASTRDLRASAGIDASVKYIRTASDKRLEVNTLPMHVSIDLQRLDETFSWFGGLSSVLNLGSSIASNSTVTTTTPIKPKARGVRFEASEATSLPSALKADIRIGGFVLDLIGTECSIGVETSAIKIISRGAVLGAAIQKIMLSGPHLKMANNDPAITIDIIGTRIEFLQTPEHRDLDTLLSLITPSKSKYDQDDDILLDTLLRQRRQGSVLRLTMDDCQIRINSLEDLSYLPELGEEVGRLSTVAKYLPEDDRPGLLSLVKIKNIEAHINVGGSIGNIRISAKDSDVAQITFPFLVALSMSTLSVHRNGNEELIGAATDVELREPGARAPAIMARMIGDEMEPIVKVKLWNLKAEYRVATLLALLDLTEHATAQDISASLTASVATLTGKNQLGSSAQRAKATNLVPACPTETKPLTIDIILRDCIIGLNPLGLESKLLLVLAEARLTAVLPEDKNANATAELGKASVLVIDNMANLVPGNAPAKSRRESFDGGSSQVASLCGKGWVPVSYISSAQAIVRIRADEDGEKSIDVELRDDLFVLESCADSTQTLLAILNGLTPPSPPSKELKFRTKVIPVEDLLKSLSGDAFGRAEGNYNFDEDFGTSNPEDILGEEDADDLNFDSQYYQLDDQYEEAILEEDGSVSSSQLTTRDTQDGVMLDSLVDAPESSDEVGELEFHEDHFSSGPALDGTAHRWNSAKNSYDKSDRTQVRKSPLKVRVRDVHIIWHLFDGYDWQQTRDTLARAVHDVEAKAIERRARNERRSHLDVEDEDEETVIGDFLFNSIYIDIPRNRDPHELALMLNRELMNDNMTDTESVATTTASAAPSVQGGSRYKRSKRLRLERSKHHKITFELTGVCADLVVFPQGSGETQSSVDIRVRDLEIFDHIPSSTWRKFATYMQEAGERETGTSMVHIEILNVRPVPELAASEIVLKATVLPLRLHVDQHALDFIERFFAFKDDSTPVNAPSGDVPFLQRVEVNSIPVKLDFKPKHVDYAGLRAGHTTELMNFVILEEANMILRHTIIYGVSGFDKLGKTLNDIWMPEIKRNQLPGILAGLAPVRTFVDVGTGIKHLVEVPMQEYRKDGRVLRSISKGAAAFGKSTGTALVKLGAKGAIGIQTLLQDVEGLVSPTGEPLSAGLEDNDTDEGTKQISLYANQPVGVLQGLKGGYAGFSRDILKAKDAIIAVPGEIMESGSATGVVKAVRRHGPTVVFRPAIGVFKGAGQVLMGATNALDPSNLAKADAVS
ncbi:hypothetical protein B0O99DRAFT_505027 [Bisporella sp. PMI_857]|nr:hypothetical protein B0O99DRAFT_505027 [Bisporella sp. PMI_857]